MAMINKLKPRFWDHDETAAGPYRHHFNFRRLWKRSVLATATVALVPLFIWSLSGYRLNADTIDAELVLRTSQLTANSWRAVSLFLSERRSVLDFIAHDNTFEVLNDPGRLTVLLENLNRIQAA
jgi:two-component system NtrC family sensor kinase